MALNRSWSTAECGDLAITAAEGGIGHWAVIDSYHPTREDSIGEGWVDQLTAESIEVGDDFVFYTLRPAQHNDPHEEDFPPVDVTPALILRGVRLSTGAGGWLRIEDGMELGELDADEADAIIQFGAFGELVYS